jgi:hypothetical protein
VSETAEPVEDIIELEAPPQTGPAAVRPPATTQPPATAPMPAEVPAELKPPDAGAAAVASFDLSEPNLAAPAQPVSVPEHAAWEPPAEAPREAAAPGQAAPVPSGPAAAPAEPTDDINTSTLAELYITQGFFEKAIEIYEGMLAEHPGNAALQQKLEKIRAMAGVAERNAAFAVPAAGPADAGASADVFAAARRQEAAAGSQAADAPVPEPALRPAAEERPAEQAPPAGRTAPRAPQASAARRKETIDRLESWLKNVIKEKP